jgi:hypothetical protein
MLVLVFLVFASGMVIGGAASVGFVIHRIRQTIQHPEQIPANMTARLARKLDLDNSQKVRVQAIIADRQKNLQAIRREVQPRVEAEFRAGAADIGGELTPAQKAKWDAMFAELMKDWMAPAPK